MSKYLEMLQRYPYTDMLGWSNARNEVFQQCKRKYYFQYYGKYDLGNFHKINRLKNLTTVPLEIGNVTHKLIQALLRRIKLSFEPIDHAKLYDYSKRETFKICRDKEFEEVYYKKRDQIDIESEIFLPVMQAMKNLLESQRMTWMFEEALLSKDDWIIELDDQHKYGECRIDGLKAYCKVDFMFPIDEDLYIIDWKTGKPSYAKHAIQLRGYAGWSISQFGVSVDSVKTTIAHLLPEYEENTVQLNEFDLDDFVALVRAQTNEMYEFCEVPETNVPLKKEQFPMTTHLNFCKFCEFRELCDRAEK
jgi:hypothetical protein